LRPGLLDPLDTGRHPIINAGLLKATGRRYPRRSDARSTTPVAALGQRHRDRRQPRTFLLVDAAAFAAQPGAGTVSMGGRPTGSLDPGLAISVLDNIDNQRFRASGRGGGRIGKRRRVELKLHNHGGRQPIDRHRHPRSRYRQYDHQTNGLLEATDGGAPLDISPEASNNTAVVGRTKGHLSARGSSKKNCWVDTSHFAGPEADGRPTVSCTGRCQDHRKELPQLRAASGLSSALDKHRQYISGSGGGHREAGTVRFPGRERSSSDR